MMVASAPSTGIFSSRACRAPDPEPDSPVAGFARIQGHNRRPAFHRRQASFCQQILRRTQGRCRLNFSDQPSAGSPDFQIRVPQAQAAHVLSEADFPSHSFEGALPYPAARHAILRAARLTNRDPCKLVLVLTALDWILGHEETYTQTASHFGHFTFIGELLSDICFRTRCLLRY
jgi:hypothetical protein